MKLSVVAGRRWPLDTESSVDDTHDGRPAPPDRCGDRVALMINGLGGTPISELYLVYRPAHRRLAERGITVGRSYLSEYCTSLDMAGASLTLVRLDEEIDRLLAAPALIF